MCLKYGGNIKLLLLLRAERRAQERAQHALNELAWERKLSGILHEVTLATYNLRTSNSVYESTLRTVCAKLNWDIGHVFIVDEQDKRGLLPSHFWHSSDNEVFRDFHSATLLRRYHYGEGMVGSAWQRRETVWSPNIRDNPSCNRAVFLRDVPSLTGVALPIFVEDALASVIEFFTRDENARPKRYKPFFDILGVHLGNVLSRQRVSAREHEQALQLAASSKMATLGKLAAGIAHEINDPLSTLYTTIQLLERMQRTSDAFSVDNSARPEHIHLQRAHRGLTQIRKVVSSLQSFSRDSSRDAYTEVSLAILLEHTLDLCAARFANKGISLEIPNIPPTLTVECRESQISQVLLNLLSNAFDAAIETAEKWIRVDTKDDGGMVELGVTDSGTGIDPNLAAKIMSPFFTTKPPGKGTGLGLSIANSIIAEHAGELSIDQSSLNTRFVIKLPKRAGRTTKRV